MTEQDASSAESVRNRPLDATLRRAIYYGACSILRAFPRPLMPRVGWPNHHLGLPGLWTAYDREILPAGGMMGGWMTVLTSLDGRCRC